MHMSEDGDRALLREGAERALTSLISGDVLRGLLDAKGHYDERYWQHCRDQGWTAIGIPEQFGGIGLGLAEACVLAEITGACAAGAPFLETQFIASQAILRHGSDDTRSEWLPRLADGTLIGIAGIIGGADIVPRRPAVNWDRGRLNGRQPKVPAAAHADLAILFVETGAGAALALADLRGEGVERTLVNTFDNSRCTADLMFTDAPAMLFDIDDPVSASADLLSTQAVIVAHQQLGGAGKMMMAARDYALQRRAFGQPIGAFQAVKHRIAEDYILIELARASAAEAVEAADTAGFARVAAAARILAADAYETATRDAMQIFGGLGASWESDLHLHQRRARTLALETGPPMAWEDLLVDELVKDAV